MLSADDKPKPGLRERKKAKTRAAIQRCALRLFMEQGYEETTIEQIAEAAEVSPSTFFRYFPTKEDVALYDDLDPVLIASFNAQPAEMNPIQAMRAALRAVFESLPHEELERQWERSSLLLTVPELRMRLLDQFTDLNSEMTQMIAKRARRRPDDFAVRAYSGALLGALLTSIFDGVGETLDHFLARMDATLEYLETGLRL
ncbi:MAG TPA: TetR family transcriptional regulator [Ktedonobacterales bacterium]